MANIRRERERSREWHVISSSSSNPIPTPNFKSLISYSLNPNSPSTRFLAMGGPTNRWDGGSHSLGREESSLHTRSASHGRSEPSFGSSNSRRRMVKVCGCGVEAPLLTSWTGDNPGRRFYGCGLFKVHGRRLCRFFEWYDDVGNAREKKVIALLSRKNAEMKKTITVLVCCLIFASLLISIASLLHVN